MKGRVFYLSYHRFPLAVYTYINQDIQKIYYCDLKYAINQNQKIKNQEFES